MSHVKVQHTTGSVPGFAGASGTGLLQTLVAWVTSNSGVPGLDWTVEMNQTVRDESGATLSGSSFREVILSNTGLSGNEEIIIGLREYSYPSTNEYNIELNGYLAVPAG